MTPVKEIESEVDTHLSEKAICEIIKSYFRDRGLNYETVRLENDGYGTTANLYLSKNDSEATKAKLPPWIVTRSTI